MRLPKLPLKPVIAIAALCLLWVLFRAGQWMTATKLEPQAYLVLGGSPLREVHAAKLLKLHPERKILISTGSPDPCVYLLCQKNGAPVQNVWTEKCAQNTFENFVYTLPILEKWGVRRVAVVTDYPQVVRAMPVANILLSSHGIVVDLEKCPEVLGDNKSKLEVVGFEAMACAYAILSQFYQPSCQDVLHLSDIDMPYWYREGFECQQQTGIPSHAADTSSR